MTFEDFKIKTRKRTRFDKYWYYILSVAVIILSLICFYFAITHPEKFKGSLIFSCACFTFLLALGISGFYFLPNRYKIIEIISNLSLEKKKILVKQLLEEICYVKVLDSPYIYAILKTKWWQSTYTIHFFYDQNKFAFSLQGHDFDGGFIDFGSTERRRRSISKKIKNLLG